MVGIFKIIKKFVISAILIYSFDIVAVSFNFSIPINFCTIFLVSLFDVSALCCLILFSFVF